MQYNINCVRTISGAIATGAQNSFTGGEKVYHMLCKASNTKIPHSSL